MNVAIPPVDGSGQEGVENQRTWPKLCPVCCARATNLFSAALLIVGLGILTPGDGSISSREKSELSQQLPCGTAMLRGSKDSSIGPRASHKSVPPRASTLSQGILSFLQSLLILDVWGCLFLRVLVCESTKPRAVDLEVLKLAFAEA